MIQIICSGSVTLLYGEWLINVLMNCSVCYVFPNLTKEFLWSLHLFSPDPLSLVWLYSIGREFICCIKPLSFRRQSWLLSTHHQVTCLCCVQQWYYLLTAFTFPHDVMIHWCSVSDDIICHHPCNMWAQECT